MTEKDDFPLQYMGDVGNKNADYYTHLRQSSVYCTEDADGYIQPFQDGPHYERLPDEAIYQRPLPSLPAEFEGRFSPPPAYDTLSRISDTYLTPNVPVKQRSPYRCAFIVLLTVVIAAVLGGIIYGIVDATMKDPDEITTTWKPSTVTATGTTKTTATHPTTVSTSVFTSSPTFKSTTSPGVSKPTWSEWSSWSDCSVTCNGGEQTRSRECLPEGNTACKGTDRQTQPCNENMCPGPDYAEWSDWSIWTQCSASCGDDGVQIRVRRCDKESTEQLDCPGDKQNTDKRECNRFDCPTCDRNCPSGGTSELPDCNRCICFGNSFTARVVSQTNKPLQLVTATDIEIPSYVLVTTDKNGDFTLTDACNGITLQFERYDLVTTTAIIDPNLKVIMMQKRENLDISIHPESKERLIGDSMMMCCEAFGDPPPAYYEWFKDGAEITGDAGSSEGTLILHDLKKEDSGTYQCRANNDISSVRSDTAQLKVEDDPSNFCSLLPGSNIITLPIGCEQDNGSLEFDVGACNPKPCHGDNQAGSDTCIDQQKHCCGPSKMELIRIQCRGFVLPVYLLTECGCTLCTETDVIVLGQVLAGDTRQPLADTTVHVNGTEIDVPPNANGEFSVQISGTTRRLTLTASDTTGFYSRNSKVIQFPKKPPAIYYALIYLLPFYNQGTIDPNNISIVNIGHNRTFAQVIVPENSIYTLEGIPFMDPVQVLASVIDTKIFNDVVNSPGDLSTVNLDGSTQMLKTYGMFSLKLVDLATGNELQIKDKVRVLLDNTHLKGEIDETGNPLAKLWSLNPSSGYWEFSSSMQPENDTFSSWRQDHSLLNSQLLMDIIIGDIEIDGQVWSNFDGNDYRACYSKVRLFSDNLYNENKQLMGGSVGVIVTDESLGSDTSGKVYADVSFTRAKTEQGDANGYCVIGFCDLTEPQVPYRGYIIAEVDGQRLHPAPPGENAGMKEVVQQALEYDDVVDDKYPGIKTKFSMPDIPSGEIGPLYEWTGTGGKGWEYATTCSNAQFSENHYRFYKTDVLDNPCNNPPFHVQELVTDPPPEPPSSNWLAWFAESHTDKHEVCYIKVLVTNGIGLQIAALSQMGNCSHSSGEVGQGDVYGIDQACPTSNKEALCLETKHPSALTDLEEDCAKDETLITVQHNYNRSDSGNLCRVTEISDGIEIILSNKIVEKDQIFKFYNDETSKDSLFGIYCSQSDHSIEKAVANARTKCYTGTDDDLEIRVPNSITEINWAITLDCSN